MRHLPPYAAGLSPRSEGRVPESRQLRGVLPDGVRRVPAPPAGARARADGLLHTAGWRGRATTRRGEERTRCVPRCRGEGSRVLPQRHVGAQRSDPLARARRRRRSADDGARVRANTRTWTIVEANTIVCEPDEIARRIGSSTRAIFVSHITSPTSVVVPVEEICTSARAAADVLSIVDGAHVPGHVALDLGSLGADIYAGNCHKRDWAPHPPGGDGAGICLEARQEIPRRLARRIVTG